MPGTPGMHQRHRLGLDIRQQAWNSIRVLKRFTTAQIEATAAISRDNLRKYLKALHQTGYLVQVRPKQNGKSLGHAVWRLARDSGPRAPIGRTDGSGVYDPNQDTLYPYRMEATHDPATRPGVAHGPENRLPGE
jgi:hypothetical protein